MEGGDHLLSQIAMLLRYSVYFQINAFYYSENNTDVKLDLSKMLTTELTPSH